jgi:hypothetical protein
VGSSVGGGAGIFGASTTVGAMEGVELHAHPIIVSTQSVSISTSAMRKFGSVGNGCICFLLPFALGGAGFLFSLGGDFAALGLDGIPSLLHLGAAQLVPV